MASCKSCGAYIQWFKTAATGASIPADGKPEKRLVIQSDGTAKVVDTYMPHWATCPTARQHRRVADGPENPRGHEAT